MMATYVNPALIPQYNPDNSFMGQLLGFRHKQGLADLAGNQAKYYDALQKLEGAKVPHAADMARNKAEFEKQKALEKAQKAEYARLVSQYTPQDYQSQFSLRGAQAGAAHARAGQSNAAADLSRSRISGQEGTNAWESALRSNPIFQAKTAGGRISPEVMAAISSQAAGGNSPLQMNPVDMQGQPFQQMPPQQMASQEMPQFPHAPMAGGIPFAAQRESSGAGMPQMMNRAGQPQEMNAGMPQLPKANQTQKTMYQQAYPQLDAAIQNKLDKAILANPQAATKLQFLANIKETISGIDPSVIKMYSGAAGRTKLATDEARAAAGSYIPEYAAFKEFEDTQAVILASQIRQFYGDSIQPKKEQQIMETFAKENIRKNPEVAMRKMAELIRIVDSEGKTYAKPVAGLIDEAKNVGFGKKWDAVLTKHKDEKEKIQNTEQQKPLTAAEKKELLELKALGEL
jgi:hypothetical protein